MDNINKDAAPQHSKLEEIVKFGILVSLDDEEQSLVFVNTQIFKEISFTEDEKFQISSILNFKLKPVNNTNEWTLNVGEKIDPNRLERIPLRFVCNEELELISTIPGYWNVRAIQTNLILDDVKDDYDDDDEDDIMRGLSSGNGDRFGF